MEFTNETIERVMEEQAFITDLIQVPRARTLAVYDAARDMPGKLSPEQYRVIIDSRIKMEALRRGH